MTLTEILIVSPSPENGSLLFKGMFIVVFAMIMYFSRDKKKREIGKPE